MPFSRRTTYALVVVALLIGAISLILLHGREGTPCPEDAPITCMTDAQCGESGTYGSPFCKEENLWIGRIDFRCRGVPGTCEAVCETTFGEERLKTCRTGCVNGACKE